MCSNMLPSHLMPGAVYGPNYECFKIPKQAKKDNLRKKKGS